VYDNWARLVKGVRIIERLRKKFDVEEVRLQFFNALSHAKFHKCCWILIILKVIFFKLYSEFVCVLCALYCLHCFDAVGYVTGRASG